MNASNGGSTFEGYGVLVSGGASGLGAAVADLMGANGAPMSRPSTSSHHPDWPFVRPRMSWVTLPAARHARRRPRRQREHRTV